MKNKNITLEGLRKGAAEKEKELAKVKPLLAPAIIERENIQQLMSDAAIEGNQEKYKEFRVQYDDKSTYIDYLKRRVDYLEATVVPGVSDDEIIGCWKEIMPDRQSELDAAEAKLNKAREAFKKEFMAYDKKLAEIEDERKELSCFMNDANGISRLFKLKTVHVGEVLNLRKPSDLSDPEFKAAVTRTIANFGTV